MEENGTGGTILSDSAAAVDPRLELGRRLSQGVLQPIKDTFVGKDEVVDLLGVCLVAGENLYILGPPGTAKSALVHELARRIDGQVFDYLLTRFTEPNELFGPFDIRRLREGDLVTNTEGMLPEAVLVFLDELLNANSAILNSLLAVLNERVFRRGRETRKLPTLMVVGAGNHLPEDDALGALFDRFLLRVRCDNVPAERLSDVLDAGWKLGLGTAPAESQFRVEDFRTLHRMLGDVNLAALRPAYVELIHRLRHAGITVSDRRAVKLQRLVAASALVCGRFEATASDLWIMRYIWDTEEQQEVLAAIVDEAVSKAQRTGQDHPRARGGDAPNAEHLARDLEQLAARLADQDRPAADLPYLRDRLGLLAGRCQWVESEQQRKFLDQRVDALWKQIGAKP